MAEHVQTKTEIRATLESLGIRPQKRFGQHFLIDGNLMRRLVESAEIGPGDVVLEVGCGTGGLTDLLVEAAGRVVGVEIDRTLADFLRQRFADRPGFRLVEGDVLHSKNRMASEVVATMTEGAAAAGGRTLLVANLPYNVATPLLMNLLHELPVMTRFCFTVQSDVADRIEAAPRSKAYGPLSVTLQTLTSIRRIARIPPSAFWPAPQVESAMLRLDTRENPFTTPEAVAGFIRFVREAFHHRRKTLKFNLARILNEQALTTAATLIDLTRRPEDLSVQEWAELVLRTTPSGLSG